MMHFLILRREIELDTELKLDEVVGQSEPSKRNSALNSSELSNGCIYSIQFGMIVCPNLFCQEPAQPPRASSCHSGELWGKSASLAMEDFHLNHLEALWPCRQNLYLQALNEPIMSLIQEKFGEDEKG